MEKGEEKTKIEFVIDTNILISALIPRKTKLRDILLSGDFRIYAPEYLLKELDKYWNLILEKAEKRVLLTQISVSFFYPEKDGASYG